jgi:hypothetical protein
LSRIFLSNRLGLLFVRAADVSIKPARQPQDLVTTNSTKPAECGGSRKIWIGLKSPLSRLAGLIAFFLGPWGRRPSFMLTSAPPNSPDKGDLRNKTRQLAV